MKDILWSLFRETGKIEYYLKYKELLRGDTGEGYQDRRNL